MAEMDVTCDLIWTRAIKCYTKTYTVIDKLIKWLPWQLVSDSSNLRPTNFSIGSPILMPVLHLNCTNLKPMFKVHW
jgi:hypothetical protein